MDYALKYKKYKEKYLNLKKKLEKNQHHHQYGGAIVPNNNDDGAGIMLIEQNYWNKGPAIILFNVRYWNGTNWNNVGYAEGGGTRDTYNNKKEDIKLTACRELKEESRNLIRLSTNSLDNNYAIRKGNYVCYCVQIPNGKITNNNFEHNKQIIDNVWNTYYDKFNKQYVEPYKSFAETNSMTRVYLSELVNNWNNINVQGNIGLNIKDANGNIITIQPKTRGLIRDLFFGDYFPQISHIMTRIYHY